MAALKRLRDAVGRRGVVVTVRLCVERVSPRTDWAREFVWYHLDLDAAERPSRPLEPTLHLRRGTAQDLGLLAQLPADPSVTTMTARVVGERLTAGATLWLVTEDGRAAFSCWTFEGRAPLSDRPGGTMTLPEDVALVEDSLSAPHVRGRGVAPGAWSQIAAELRPTGVSAMVTKVTVENAASRRAVEKAGFREVARMRIAGPIWRPSIAVDLGDDAPEHRWLADLRR